MANNKFIKLACFLFVFSILYCSAQAQQYWIEQQCPTTKSLFRMAFTDTLNGWAVGDSGAIVHTSNGGQNWLVQQSSIITFIEDLFFINPNTGYALSNDYASIGTIILKTTNGGANWTNSRYPDSALVIKSVYYLNALTGFMGGISPSVPVILRTTNGGANWQKTTIHFSVCFDYPILRLNFFNAMTGFACGGFFDRAGICWQTTDGGLNWEDSCIAAEPLFDVYPISANRVLAAGGDPEYGSYIYSTGDGGASWGGLFLEVYGIAQRIAPRTPSEIWIPCGNIGKFAVSSDTGGHWSPVLLQDSIRAFDTRFASPYSGWSVGNKGINFKGVILKYNSSIISVQNEQTNVPVSPVLYQNYPNPFNPSTLIRYYVPSGGNVVITVYDVSGKKVKVLDQGKVGQGEHSLEFDAGSLSSGVYFYQLKAVSDNNQYVLNKKMVLIK